MIFMQQKEKYTNEDLTLYPCEKEVSFSILLKRILNIEIKHLLLYTYILIMEIIQSELNVMFSDTYVIYN